MKSVTQNTFAFLAMLCIAAIIGCTAQPGGKERVMGGGNGVIKTLSCDQFLAMLNSNDPAITQLNLTERQNLTARCSSNSVPETFETDIREDVSPPDSLPEDPAPVAPTSNPLKGIVNIIATVDGAMLVGSRTPVRIYGVFEDGKQIEITSAIQSAIEFYPPNIMLAKNNASNGLGLNGSSAFELLALNPSNTPVKATVKFGNIVYHFFVNVTEPKILSLSVVPPFLTIPQDQWSYMKVTALDETGAEHDVTKVADIVINKPLLLASEMTANGLRVHSIGVDKLTSDETITLTASYRGKTSNSAATVKKLQFSDPESLSLNPPPPNQTGGIPTYTLNLGGVLNLGLFGNNGGNVFTLSGGVTWTSLTPEIASVSPTGIITPIKAGLAIISVKFGTLELTIHVQVSDPNSTDNPISSISIFPSEVTNVVPNASLDLVAYAHHQNGLMENITSSATWKLSAAGKDTSVLSDKYDNLGNLVKKKLQVGPNQSSNFQVVAEYTPLGASATLSSATSISMASKVLFGLQLQIVGNDQKPLVKGGDKIRLKAFASQQENSDLIDVTDLVQFSSTDTSIAVVNNTAQAGDPTKDHKGTVYGLQKNGFSSIKAELTLSSQAKLDSSIDLFVYVPATDTDTKQLVILPKDPTVSKGSQVQLEAYYKASEDNLFKLGASDNIEWLSSKPLVAVVDSITGMVMGMGDDPNDKTTLVTAKALGMTGETEIRVTNAQLNPIDPITPINPTVKVSKSLEITGPRYATRTDGTKEMLSWSSSNSDVATVSVTGTISDPDNIKIMISGKASGSATLTASHSGAASQTTLVTVEDRVVDQLIIESIESNSAITSLSLNKGESRSIRVKAKYGPEIEAVDIGSVVVTSSNQNIITYLGSGELKTGTQTGSTNFSVSFAGITKVISVNVSDAVVTGIQSISRSPAGAIRLGDNPVTLSATLVHSDGTTTTRSNLTWLSSNANVAIIENSKLKIVGSGSTTISISGFPNFATPTLSVTVNPAAYESVIIKGLKPSLAKGRTLDLSCAVKISGIAEPVAKTCAFESSSPTIATIGATGANLNAVGLGATVIKATAVDPVDNKEFYAVAALVVTPASIVGLNEITASSTDLRIGAPITVLIQGTMSDGTTQDVSNLVAWTSSDTGIATISGTAVTAISGAPATVVITATAPLGDNTTAPTKTITINVLSKTTLSISPNTNPTPSYTLALDQTKNFNATANFSDGTSAAITDWSVLNSDGSASNAATIDSSGKFSTASNSNNLFVKVMATSGDKSQEIALVKILDAQPVSLAGVTSTKTNLKPREQADLTSTWNFTDKSVGNCSAQSYVAGDVKTSNNVVIATINTTGTLQATDKTGTGLVTVSCPNELGSPDEISASFTVVINSAEPPKVAELKVDPIAPLSLNQPTALVILARYDGSTDFTPITDASIEIIAPTPAGLLSFTNGQVTALKNDFSVVVGRLKASKDGVAINFDVPVKATQPSSIVISGPAGPMSVGEERSFAAEVHFDNGSKLSDYGVNWEASNANLRTPGAAAATAKIEAMTQGQSQLTAKVGNITSNIVTIEISPATLSLTDITPTETTLTAGSAVELSTTATMSNGTAAPAMQWAIVSGAEFATLSFDPNPDSNGVSTATLTAKDQTNVTVTIQANPNGQTTPSKTKVFTIVGAKIETLVSATPTAAELIVDASSKFEVTIKREGSTQNELADNERDINFEILNAEGNVVESNDSISLAADGTITGLKSTANSPISVRVSLKTMPLETTTVTVNVSDKVCADCKENVKNCIARVDTSNPITLNSAADLLAVQDGKSYILGQNIALAGKFSPINGITSIIIDGNDKKISNLSIDAASMNSASSYAGIFSEIACGYFKDLTLDNVDIDLESITHVGSIVGSINKDLVQDSTLGSKFENITIKGLIKGKNNVGGVAGHVLTDEGFTVKNLDIRAKIIATEEYAGGAFGYLKAVPAPGSDVVIESGPRRTEEDIPVLAKILSFFQEKKALAQDSSPDTRGDGDAPTDAKTLLSEIEVIGSVSGSGNVGGINGSSINVAIHDSFMIGKINSTNADGHGFGGISGYMEGEQLSFSYFDGSITGKKDTGGLVGHCLTTINSSEATDKVEGTSNSGGLVGKFDQGCFITKSFYDGQVQGTDSIGGLIGSNVIETSMENTIVLMEDAYVRGTVLQGYGLVGQSAGSAIVRRAYAAVDQITAGIGNGNITVVSSYFDKEISKTTTSGLTLDPFVMALPTSEMKTQSSFDGWDFANLWVINVNAADNTLDYPSFRREKRQPPNNLLSKITVTGPQTITPGDAPTQLTVKGYLNDGSEDSTLTAADLSWTSSNTGVLTVSTSGVVTAVGSGDAIVVGSKSGIDGSVTIRVGGFSGDICDIPVVDLSTIRATDLAGSFIEITTPEGLAAISSGNRYKIIGNIDMTAYLQAKAANGERWVPKSLRNVFIMGERDTDGNKATITGFSLDLQATPGEKAAFFKGLECAVVRDITFDNPVVKTNKADAAILTNRIGSETLISNVNITGDLSEIVAVSDDDTEIFVGGIASIIECGDIPTMYGCGYHLIRIVRTNVMALKISAKGKTVIGGIAGKTECDRPEFLVIMQSYTYHEVTDSEYIAAGIVGWFGGGEIRRCYSWAKLNGWLVSGIVGYMNDYRFCYLYRCYFSGRLFLNQDLTTPDSDNYDPDKWGDLQAVRYAIVPTSSQLFKIAVKYAIEPIPSSMLKIAACYWDPITVGIAGQGVIYSGGGMSVTSYHFQWYVVYYWGYWRPYHFWSYYYNGCYGWYYPHYYRIHYFPYYYAFYYHPWYYRYYIDYRYVLNNPFTPSWWYWGHWNYRWRYWASWSWAYYYNYYDNWNWWWNRYYYRYVDFYVECKTGACNAIGLTPVFGLNEDDCPLASGTPTEMPTVANCVDDGTCPASTYTEEPAPYDSCLKDGICEYSTYTDEPVP